MCEETAEERSRAAHAPTDSNGSADTAQQHDNQADSQLNGSDAGDSGGNNVSGGQSQANMYTSKDVRRHCGYSLVEIVASCWDRAHAAERYLQSKIRENLVARGLLLGGVYKGPDDLGFFGRAMEMNENEVTSIRRGLLELLRDENSNPFHRIKIACFDKRSHKAVEVMCMYRNIARSALPELLRKCDVFRNLHLGPAMTILRRSTGERVFTEAWTGMFWPALEATLKLSTHDRMLAVMLYSDKTTVCNLGNLHAHPIVATLANLSVDHQRSPKCQVIVGYFPTEKVLREHFADPADAARQAMAQLADVIIDQLEECVTAGGIHVCVRPPGGGVSVQIKLKPALFMWLNDRPERAALVGVRTGSTLFPCTLCELRRNNTAVSTLARHDLHCPYRSQRQWKEAVGDDIMELLKARVTGRRGGVTALAQNLKGNSSHEFFGGLWNYKGANDSDLGMFAIVPAGTLHQYAAGLCKRLCEHCVYAVHMHAGGTTAFFSKVLELQDRNHYTAVDFRVKKWDKVPMTDTFNSPGMVSNDFPGLLLRLAIGTGNDDTFMDDSTRTLFHDAAKITLKCWRKIEYTWGHTPSDLQQLDRELREVVRLCTEFIASVQRRGRRHNEQHRASASDSAVGDSDAVQPPAKRRKVAPVPVTRNGPLVDYPKVHDCLHICRNVELFGSGMILSESWGERSHQETVRKPSNRLSGNRFTMDWELGMRVQERELLLTVIDSLRAEPFEPLPELSPLAMDADQEDEVQLDPPVFSQKLQLDTVDMWLRQLDRRCRVVDTQRNVPADTVVQVIQQWVRNDARRDGGGGAAGVVGVAAEAVQVFDRCKVRRSDNGGVVLSLRGPFRDVEDCVAASPVSTGGTTWFARIVALVQCPALEHSSLHSEAAVLVQWFEKVENGTNFMGWHEHVHGRLDLISVGEVEREQMMQRLDTEGQQWYPVEL